MLTNIVLDSLVTGLPLAPLTLGVYVVFRIRQDFDLTVEGSFALGAAVAAVLLVAVVHPFLAVVAGALAGAAAGAVTAALHLGLGIPVLLAGLIMSIGLFSVTLHVLTGPTVGLAGAETIFTVLGVTGDAGQVLVLAALVAAVLGAFALFLRTELGLALRASGAAPAMVRSQGVGDAQIVTLSLCLANLLAALRGALLVQVQGFADVNLGIGMFVAAIGAVLLGTLAVRPSGSRVLRIVAAVVVGTLTYRLVLVAALRFGLPAADLKAITALTLVAAVAVQRYGAATLGRAEPALPAAVRQ
ncbi:putative ABC transport system permease protein [Pseudonocardia thermophila]|uniref:Putative ABC transport system permease protein n=1 Tax=Pseudonocardia thermophila TaxID=1848 RepID=A0A1M6Y0R2_PSETH|nr:ABC transporter permease [Pseudonocardia thermophila]SHL11810.1 putative ABC transport system permease protein [Pseudonocardia thermophila]